MSGLFDGVSRFCKHNSSTILTFVGAVGMIATTITAAKNAPKAAVILEDAKKKKGDDLTALEKLKAAAPVYIPTILLGATTLACIFGANALNRRQQAALISAYALIDSSYKDYKKKVEVIHGEDIDAHIREELAKDRYEDFGIIPDEGETLFYDEFSERYFNATMERVRHAEYIMNRNLATAGYACLNEWYDALGIEPIKSGYHLGWCMDQMLDIHSYAWIDFVHDKFELDDGLEVCIISMPIEPAADFMDD